MKQVVSIEYKAIRNYFSKVTHPQNNYVKIMCIFKQMSHHHHHHT